MDQNGNNLPPIQSWSAACLVDGCRDRRCDDRSLLAGSILYRCANQQYYLYTKRCAVCGVRCFLLIQRYVVTQRLPQHMHWLRIPISFFSLIIFLTYFSSKGILGNRSLPQHMHWLRIPIPFYFFYLKKIFFILGYFGKQKSPSTLALVLDSDTIFKIQRYFGKHFAST